MVSNLDAPAAPGQLEQVRGLLNSWWISNATHQQVEDFDAWANEHNIRPREHDDVRGFRESLRHVLSHAEALDASATDWCLQYAIMPVIRFGRIEFVSTGGAAARLATIAVTGIGDGTFARLKTCPGCGWAFYDHSRNGSKRWCVMNATNPGGRGCGNAAKARRFRERAKTQLPT